MTNDKYIPRMRTVDNAFIEIKRLDPDTDFSKRALRRMVNQKEIPTVPVGNKKLINLDLLIAKLSGGWYNQSDTCTSSAS